MRGGVRAFNGDYDASGAWVQPESPSACHSLAVCGGAFGCERDIRGVSGRVFAPDGQGPGVGQSRVQGTAGKQAAVGSGKRGKTPGTLRRVRLRPAAVAFFDVSDGLCLCSGISGRLSGRVFIRRVGSGAPVLWQPASQHAPLAAAHMVSVRVLKGGAGSV